MLRGVYLHPMPVVWELLCNARVCFCKNIEVIMKIAQVAPLIESVPPRLYGGTERIVSYLTEELVKLVLIPSLPPS